MKNLILGMVTLFSMVACSEQAPVNDTKEARRTEDNRKAANETEASIYKSADSMMTAFIKHDWKGFALFTHPAMLRVMGGADNIAFMVKQQMQNVPDTVIKSARVEKVLQVEKVDNELQCLVEQKIVMEMEGNRIVSTSYLIGESLNQGKSWTFFDASDNGKIKPLDVKPNLSPDLKIPPKKQEVQPI
jgi:hypothetical protein